MKNLPFSCSFLHLHSLYLFFISIPSLIDILLGLGLFFFPFHFIRRRDPCSGINRLVMQSSSVVPSYGSLLGVSSLSPSTTNNNNNNTVDNDDNDDNDADNNTTIQHPNKVPIPKTSRLIIDITNHDDDYDESHDVSHDVSHRSALSRCTPLTLTLSSVTFLLVLLPLSIITYPSSLLLLTTSSYPPFPKVTQPRFKGLSDIMQGKPVETGR